MASSTMVNLRELSPLASSAAVLPMHALRFNIPGLVGVEPSSASVEPLYDGSDDGSSYWDVDALIERGEMVHGVLYKLSSADFASVCQTEGVPFAYCLHRCRAIPYAGDGKRAGEDCLRETFSKRRDATTENTTPAQTINNNEWGIPAFTLRAARKEWRLPNKDIPPSQSYLNVLLRGAKEFALDQSYVQKLERVKVGRTLFGNGLAEGMLRAAEERTSRKK
jgi:hypothetical protein